MLCIKAVINLENPNALITLAHVSANANNPYKAFCEYIKYYIFTQTSDLIDISEIKVGVKTEFGLEIPYNILTYCIRNRLKDCLVFEKAQHRFRRIGSFDVEGFEKARNEVKRIEDNLIDALLKYVEGYGRKWTREYAVNQLIKVLDKDGFAYDIFVNAAYSDFSSSNSFADKFAEQDKFFYDEDEVDAKQDDISQQPLYNDRFFVGKFIQKTISEDTYLKQYLIQICEGLMICIGTYQLPHTDAGVTRPQIRGTTFFFDTRLLLRYIGCAGQAAVKAAQELVELIQRNGGKICYYQHTLSEMTKAFDDAISSLNNRMIPYDNEMRIYAKSVKNNIPVLQLMRNNLVQNLEKSHIFLRASEAYSDNERIEFGFDFNDLKHYMFSQLDWKPQTIENDAMSIWETHMRRRGNYNEYCGTKQHLCVFVTSNSRLVSIALGYKDLRSNTPHVREWKNNRLPIITDIKLTCRLWSPSDNNDNVTVLNLMANAMAAQRPTTQYINKVRELAEQFSSQVPEYANISLSEYFDDIADSILEKTQGKDEELNIGVFSSSIQELAEMKARDQEKITNQVTRERDDITQKYSDQTSEIIKSAVDSYKNMLGIWKVWLWIALHCPLILGIVITMLSAVVSFICRKLLIVILAIGVLAILGEFIKRDRIKARLISLLLPQAEKHLEEKIKSKLRTVEIPYKDQIIAESKESNKLLGKCRKALLSKEQ